LPNAYGKSRKSYLLFIDPLRSVKGTRLTNPRPEPSLETLTPQPGTGAVEAAASDGAKKFQLECPHSGAMVSRNGDDASEIAPGLFLV
jgi:hypothetical protein